MTMNDMKDMNDNGRHNLSHRFAKEIQTSIASADSGAQLRKRRITLYCIISNARNELTCTSAILQHLSNRFGGLRNDINDMK